MADGRSDVSKRILTFLRGGEAGYTIREIARNLSVPPAYVLEHLHALEDEGNVEFLVMRGLWKIR